MRSRSETETSLLSAPVEFLRGREKLVMMIGIWLAVYPTVTVLTYLTEEWHAGPTYVRTFVTTLLTVPFITFLVVPAVKRVIRKAEGDEEEA